LKSDLNEITTNSEFI
jgi:hypothetical protein